MELWGVHWGGGWDQPFDGHLAFLARKGPAGAVVWSVVGKAADRLGPDVLASSGGGHLGWDEDKE